MERLIVDLGERSYPIMIGEGLLSNIAEYCNEHGLSKQSPLMIITDEQVAQFYLAETAAALRAGGYTVVEAIVPAGEKSKSLSQLEQLVGIALQAGLDRKSAVIALGGGVVGDLAGFVAASFMRGIRFIQVPTTILAHDSSVGGKVAVNHPYAKNIIGAFHQPEFVLYDMNSIRTLPEREVKAGFAEVVKHGLIWDREFVEWCSEHADALLALDLGKLSKAIHEGCKIKAKVVSEDERENGLRAILNLGHTIGHALEAVAQYDELLHGEAISIGMVGSARLAKRFGYSIEIYEQTKRLLKQFGLPVRLPAHLDTDQIMSALMHDKKFKEGKLVFVVPTAIGQVEIRNDVPADWIREIVDELKTEE